MSEQMSLGGILDGETRSSPVQTDVSRETITPAVPPAAPPAEPPQPAPPEVPAVERQRGPDGKFLAKDAVQPDPVAPAQPAAPPPAATHLEMTPQHRAAIAQANDERRKRQALEARLAQLEAGKPKESPKTFWEDPEGTLNTFRAQIDAVAMNTRLNTAETIARSKYPDFEETIGTFGEILGQVPGLHQQWLASPDPAEFAYRTAKSHMELKQAGSLDAMRTQIEKETRLKVEAEFKAKADQEAVMRQAIPASLSDVRATGGNHPPAWGGPMSLDSILSKA